MPEEIRVSVKIELPIQLIVPSYVDKRLLGFLVLGNKLNNSLYSKEDIDVFATLSNQAALASANCLFMQEFKKQQERLFTAEKLASVGGMAEGVAHQIKNRLNLFSVTSGEMQLEAGEILDNLDELVKDKEQLKSKIEYIKQCTVSVNDNVKKTAGIIQGILNFAKSEEKDTYFSLFPLKESIDQSLNMLMVKHQLNAFPLCVDLPSPDRIYAIKSQMNECIYNILDNSFESIKEKIDYHLEGREKLRFVPQITLRLQHKEKASLIEISDNGMGIREENMKKVFAPFFTTKSSYKSGSGIGMYVVRRMIEENHKGKIWFKTDYPNGITFFIEIPGSPAV
ncbi:MAG: GAF domain-containing sensor histidine kinase [Endomicrobiales bacterium]